MGTKVRDLDEICAHGQPWVAAAQAPPKEGAAPGFAEALLCKAREIFRDLGFSVSSRDEEPPKGVRVRQEAGDFALLAPRSGAFCFRAFRAAHPPGEAFQVRTRSCRVLTYRSPGTWQSCTAIAERMCPLAALHCHDPGFLQLHGMLVTPSEHFFANP